MEKSTNRRTNAPSFFVAVTTAILSGCWTASEAPKDQFSERNGHTDACVVHDVPDYVGKAICSGRLQAIKEAVERYRSIPVLAPSGMAPEKFTEQWLRPFAMLFLKDPAAGKGIPWELLENTQIQLWLAEIATSYTGDPPNFALISEARRRVVPLAKEDFAQGGVLGISALAAVQPRNQEAWLHEIVLRHDAAESARTVAAMVLSAYCTDRAGQLIASLNAQADRFPLSVRSVLAQAPALRASNQAACNHKRKYGLVVEPDVEPT